METLQKVCLTLTILGALNWGLVGLFDFNLVVALFGEGALMTNLLYSLIGLAGIINIGLLLSHDEHHEIKR
jgi:uncharacterized membrane protein YuzA (DUF378 family)